MPDEDQNNISRNLAAATAFINTNALRHNASLAKSLAPKAALLCMIKANAYGHGLVSVSQQLTTLADAYGVARLTEAIQLRNSGCDKPIVVMSQKLNKELLEEYKIYQLTAVIHCESNAKSLSQTCQHKKIPYWLKIDTGMHRLGLKNTPPSDALNKAHVIATHLHSADNLESRSCDTQISALNPVACDNTNAGISVANSAALLRAGNPTRYQTWLQSCLAKHAHRQEFIRPGIMLYGANPLSQTTPCSALLQPVMTFAAPVIDIHTIAAGETVGYNQRWRAKRNSVIATVAAGYADGYPRHATNGTPVRINGADGKLVGTVSMDMIGVDVTDIAQRSTVQIGDTAILWGPALPVETIAKHANTISYNLLTSVSERVPRIYSDNETGAFSR